LVTAPSDEHEKDCAEVPNIRVRLEDVLLLERVDSGEGEITDHLADALALLGVIAHWKCQYLIRIVEDQKCLLM
jgi:hypothetical protein